MQAAGGPSDVIVVGGGFAGSLLALTLARRGVGARVVDLHRTYGSDFRCEKFNPDQAALLGELGAVEAMGADGPEALVQTGLRYDQMVNGLRAAWPTEVLFHQARVVAIDAGENLQHVTLSTGETLSGRLIALATGPGERLRRSLGIRRRLLRERHSLCIGFSLAPGGAEPFPFQSLIRRGARPGDGLAFVSLFPMNGVMRVNLFSYRDPAGPWARSFRYDPLAALLRTFPGLEPQVGQARVVAPAEFGVTDLYEAQDHLMAGVVVIGDAFRSSCPATGMGMTRILTDVRQLACVHAPAWLATPGMPAGKIAQFYDDPVKQAVDHKSHRTAEAGRSAATATSLRWRAYRTLSGLKRAWRRGIAAPSPAVQGAAS